MDSDSNDSMNLPWATWAPIPRPEISQTIRTLSDAELTRLIRGKLQKTYNQAPRELQVKSILRLVRRQDTFLLAATGYGKSRIADGFASLFPEDSDYIVLVINPLDVLGEYQVREKERANISAINLTYSTWSREVAKDLKAGKYRFVYLSPKIFLNNEEFGELYYSKEFRNKLVLKVVDEAQMIYDWSLCESGEAKHIMSLVRQQDRGVFWPSYGNICKRLMATESAPLLLMSATCRPQAVSAILSSLKLSEDRGSVQMLRGELTRPEITFVRIPMSHSLASADDLQLLFAPKSVIPDDKVCPTLVFCGSLDRTLQMIQVMNAARGNRRDTMNPVSSFVRRYHSVTGRLDQKERIEEYSQGKYPVISCSMALALGQHWPRVRMVVHLGRSSPSSLQQMLGRCGRDGRLGLGVMFVQKSRRGGKNQVSDFKGTGPMDEDECMDALAITPVCLRIAFSCNNCYGRIPMSKDEPIYLKEYARERERGFPACQCTNCCPTFSSGLIPRLANLTTENFDIGMSDPKALGDPLVAPYVVPKKKKPRFKTCSAEDPIKEDPLFLELAELLAIEHANFVSDTIGAYLELDPSDYLHDCEVWKLCKNLETVRSIDDVKELIGGDMIKGSCAKLFSLIKQWKDTHKV